MPATIQQLPQHLSVFIQKQSQDLGVEKSEVTKDMVRVLKHMDLIEKMNNYYDNVDNQEFEKELAEDMITAIS